MNTRFTEFKEATNKYKEEMEEATGEMRARISHIKDDFKAEKKRIQERYAKAIGAK